MRLHPPPHLIGGSGFGCSPDLSVQARSNDCLDCFSVAADIYLRQCMGNLPSEANLGGRYATPAAGAYLRFHQPRSVYLERGLCLCIPFTASFVDEMQIACCGIPGGFYGCRRKCCRAEFCCAAGMLFRATERPCSDHFVALLRYAC